MHNTDDHRSPHANPPLSTVAIGAILVGWVAFMIACVVAFWVWG